MKEKRSFFKRLTGAIAPESEYEEFPDTITEPDVKKNDWIEEDNDEGQLTVDVYETATHIIIKTIVAGVKKEDLEISLSRDMAIIRGRREADDGIEEGDYFHKELYWGTFSRTILLPTEVDIDRADAIENQGLLTIKLPKIDKEKQTRLKIKSI